MNRVRTEIWKTGRVAASGLKRQRDLEVWATNSSWMVTVGSLSHSLASLAGGHGSGEALTSRRIRTRP
jgi:hypothetical protein